MSSNSIENTDHAEWEVAIVGMAGRFPHATNWREFWANISGGVECLDTFSDDQLRSSGIPEAVFGRSNYVRRAGIVAGADRFDAGFFGVSAHEAELLDPQQRHFLECGWEALEDAGWDPALYPGRIGVYAGVGINSYLLRNVFPNGRAAGTLHSLEMLIGGDKDFLSTRLAFKLGLEGPCLTVQTACSTSLVAVHLACQALLGGDCEMALAGGVTIRTPQHDGYVFEEGLIFSPDGRCRAFDAQATGSVPASGLGIVVLKRLPDAIRDRDCIRAVIRGSAVNNDGASKVGFTAPRLDGQAQVIRDALRVAAVSAASIGFVEAHGSGTPVGDAVELGALEKVFAAAAPRSCALGSVKVNLGHCDIAAGVAGLMKAALALQHKTIPPSLNFQSSAHGLGSANSPFYVNSESLAWTSEHPRRAGVSSFGLGGSNAHVILEEAPAFVSNQSLHSHQLLLLSARSSGALDVSSKNLLDHLANSPKLEIADVAFTLATGRRAFSHRRAILASSLADARSALDGESNERLLSGLAQETGRAVSFLLPGVGDQYPGMGAHLYTTEPVFRETIDLCATILKRESSIDLIDLLLHSAVDTPRSTDMDLRAMLGRGDTSLTAEPELTRTALAHPALFAVEYALASLWASWGVRPVAMLGYSLGEYVAACLAGVFSLADALCLVERRARLIDALELGVMIAVSLPESEAQRYTGDGVWLAAVNAPASCILSVTEGQAHALELRLASADVVFRRVKSTHGFHSEMMRPAAQAFAEYFAGVPRQAPTIPFISNLTGSWITPEQATSASYWVEHMCQTVRFSVGLENLTEEYGVLLEVGPGQGLSALALQAPVRASRRGVLAVPSMRHRHQPDHESLVIQRAAANLWLAGVDLDWRGFYAAQQRRRVSLPTYPFERQRYWLDAPELDSVATSERQNPDDWFYLPSHRRTLAQRVTRATDRRRRCVVLGPRNELSDAVVCALSEFGYEPLSLESTLGGTPGRPRLLVRLAEDSSFQELGSVWLTSDAGFELAVVLPHPEQERSQGLAGLSDAYHHLVALAQVVPSLASEFEIVAVTCDPERHGNGNTDSAATLAACNVISQEHAKIRCRHIQVSGRHDSGTVASLIAAEVDAATPERAVCYLGPNDRRVPSFDRVKIAGNQPSVLRSRGTYVITGGIGNLGLSVARSFAEKVNVKLLLISRSVFPDRSSWGQWCESHGADDRTSRKIAKLLDLEQSGADVMIAQADVSDELAMKQAFDEAEERFGPIHGVIHAAGSAGDLVAAADATWTSAQDLFRAKCVGLDVLNGLVNARNLDFAAIFSSTASVLGGPGLLSYAATSAYVDALACLRAEASGVPWLSIAWDGWLTDELTSSHLQHVGIAAQFLQETEALDALHRLLSSRLRGSVAVSAHFLPARVERWTSLNADSGQQLEAESASSVRAGYAAPESEIERFIASLWEEVLGVKPVGLHDGFFELGGDSLLGTKVVSRIRESFQVPFAMRQLWANPTVARLAPIIEELVIDDLLENDNQDEPRGKPDGHV